MHLKEKTYVTTEVSEKTSAEYDRKTEAPSKNMTSRSLFNIILKILGIYFIKDILLALSQSLSVIVYLPQYQSPQEALYNLAAAGLPVFLYTLFSWLMIFRTERVMEVFKLYEQTEEAVSFRIHHSTILSIAIIVMGGVILVNEIPELFRQGIYYLQERKLYERMAHPDISYFLMAAFRVSIGLALIFFNKFLVNFIEVRRKNKSPWYWPFRFFRRNKKRR